MKPIIDERNYTVIGVNGYRVPNLTRGQATRKADQVRQQMKQAGWAGKVHVVYRDGSVVPS